MLRGKLTTAHLAYGSKGGIIGQELLQRGLSAKQLASYSNVPSPRLNLNSRGSVESEIAEIVEGDKQHIVGIFTNMPNSLNGSLNIVHHHHVAIISPNGRKKTQVGTHLASGMWGCEAWHVHSQRNVVFGIEYMKSHYKFCFALLTCKVRVFIKNNKINGHKKKC